MTEWQVVGVLITMFGLITAIVTPLIKLNSTIVKLTEIVNILGENLKTVTIANTKSHGEFYKELDEHEKKILEHDLKLKEHEKRISKIEETK